MYVIWLLFAEIQLVAGICAVCISDCECVSAVAVHRVIRSKRACSFFRFWRCAGGIYVVLFQEKVKKSKYHIYKTV